MSLGPAIPPSRTVGAVGSRTRDCDCRIHSWTRRGRLSLHERVTRDRTFSEANCRDFLLHRDRSLRCGMTEPCQEPYLPDHERPVQILLDSFSRSETLCITGEATEGQSASGLHTGMVLQRSLACNTSRCSWHIEQRV